MYSVFMMVGPALFLLGLGFMTSGGFWQAILKTSRLQHASERCNYRMKSLTKLFQPFLAPMVYITIALMNGDFFVCSSLGSLSAACYSNVQDKDVLQQVRKKDCLCGNCESGEETAGWRAFPYPYIASYAESSKEIGITLGKEC